MALADTPTRTAILAEIDRRLDASVQLLRDMIDVPSVGPWFGEPEDVSGEGGIQALLRARLESLGASIDEWEPSAAALAHHEGGPGYFADRDFTGRPNLVGTIAPTTAVADPSAPALMFLGHCDVVPGGPGWTTPGPFRSTLADGRVYGRGACDMKGGMAAALAAIEAVLAVGVPLSNPISYASVTEEETGGMGTLALVDRGYRPGIGIVIPEPTSLKVAPLCRGILWGEIVIPGKSGHIEIEQPGWRDGGAVDAIAHGRRLLAEIDALNARWTGLPEKNHRYMPLPCQMHVAQIDAGTYPSSWAGSFTVRFDIQYLPGELDERGGGGVVRGQVEQMLADFVGDDEWLRENPPVITWLVDADCGETEDSQPIVTSPLAVMRSLGREAVIEGVTSHTDMGLPIKAGVPSVTFGPGFLSVAHQPDEFLDIDEFKAAIEIMALMIVDLCGAGESDG